MRAHVIAGIAAAILGTTTLATAEPPPPAVGRRVYTTAQVNPHPPRLDGIPDDDCWSKVEWATDFVQWEPSEGQPPTYQTAFKILYDDRALYVAYRCFDAEPAQIARHLSRRDGFPGDWVEINIDSYLDHQTAYSFTTSVSGTRGDEFVSQDGDMWDGNWDPIWRAATHVDGQGWTAEIQIPLSQLRFVDREGQVWGIQVQRRLFRKQERSLWQPKSKSERGWVSRFGELRGIRDIRPQRQVELLPYTVARAENDAAIPGNPFEDGSDHGLAVGLDGKVGVSSNLTVDFTVNPDFGQVEADPSEVNLSAFETRFDEKRPFFIEGSNIIDFQISPAITGGDFTADNLFYSRRVGRPPRGTPDLADGEYADIPTATSILLATKLTGRTERGLSVGVLESVTGRENAPIVAPGGAERDETVEPLANFFAGRLQQDLRGGASHFGGMLTAVHRDIDSPQLGFLHRSAWTGGVDLYHAWRNRSWYAALDAAASRVAGDPAAILTAQTSSARYFQRPDNDHAKVDSARTSLVGHAGAMRLGKTGGKHWRFETGGTWRSPGFEINDIGYMRRADEVTQFGWAQYSIRNPFSIFRGLYVNANEWLRWDFGGARLLEQANVNSNLTFRNNWSLYAGTTRNWRNLSNTALRGGPSLRIPGEREYSFNMGSDSSRPLAVYAGTYFYRMDESAARLNNSWMDVTWRPSNALSLTLSPSYSEYEDELQYVSTTSWADAPRYLFGTIEQRTGTLTFRLNYTVRPNLTVQYYGAPFVAAGSYRDFKRITAPHAADYHDRFHVFAADEIAPTDGGYEVDEDGDGNADYGFGNPDFDFRDFNSNLVVRWEYQPGSLLYLVWSQARTSFASGGRLDLGDDSQALFATQPHDIFLVKLSKWFSL